MPIEDSAAEALQETLRQKQPTRKRWVIVFRIIDDGPFSACGMLKAVNHAEAHQQMIDWLVQEGRLPKEYVTEGTRPVEGITVGDTTFYAALYGTMSEVEGFLVDMIEEIVFRYEYLKRSLRSFRASFARAKQSIKEHQIAAD